MVVFIWISSLLASDQLYLSKHLEWKTTQNLFIRPDLWVHFPFESNRSPGAVEWGWQSYSAEPFAVQGYHDGLMRRKRWFREEAREPPGPLSVGTPPLTALLSAHILNTSLFTTLFFKSSRELHEQLASHLAVLLFHEALRFLDVFVEFLDMGWLGL